jgi:hypothetical protein
VYGETYFLARLLLLVLVDLVELVDEGSGLGGVIVSGSSGAGGGVVSIVQPIHPDITKTRRTKRRTGMPIAHCCQPVL